MILSTTDLKALWINGYIPTDWDFANLFDSYAPLDPATGQILGDGIQLTGVLHSGDNVSSMTNDSGFITSGAIPTNVSSFTNDAGYLTSISGLTADTVSSLSGHNVSELTNDSAYLVNISGLTADTVSSLSGHNVSELTNDAGYYVGDGSAFATAAQGSTADSALQPNATADGTYPIYNDGTTSGQLSSITISGGLITGVTTLP